MISAPGNSPVIRALVSSAAFKLLAGSTSLAPRFASTRAVSAPIPDVAPDSPSKASVRKPSQCGRREEDLMRDRETGDDGGDGFEVRCGFGDVLGRGFGSKPTGSCRSYQGNLRRKEEDLERVFSQTKYSNPVGVHERGHIGEKIQGIQQVAVGRLPQLNVYGYDYPTKDAVRMWHIGT